MKLRNKAEIELNLKKYIPLKEVLVLESPRKDFIKIKVELPWWKWILPIFSHFWARKKIERALYANGLIDVLYAIEVR